MNEILNQLVKEVVLPIIAAVVLAQITVMLNQGRRYLEEKATAQQRETIHLLSSTAVNFAEQMFKGQAGEIRKAQAIAWLQKECEAHKIPVDVERLSAWVEAAVLEAK